MFDDITAKYRAAKYRQKNDRLIVESVMEEANGEEELLTAAGDLSEDEDLIDTESIPDNVVAKVDKLLDNIVSNPNYDDTELDELLDADEDEEGTIDVPGLGKLITEACDEALAEWND